LPGNTESTFLNDIPLVSFASEYFPISLPGDSTTFSPYSLIVSGKLSGDSTDDESINDPTSNFTMGPWEFETFGHEQNPRIPKTNAPYIREKMASWIQW
jgi:hypothetical protein